MSEEYKLAKNVTNKTQLFTKSGRTLRVEPGEVINADEVTSKNGQLFDGFEFCGVIKKYLPERKAIVDESQGNDKQLCSIIDGNKHDPLLNGLEPAEEVVIPPKTIRKRTRLAKKHD